MTRPRCVMAERSSGAWCAVHDTTPDWHSDVPGWNGRAGWVCPEREVDDVMLEAGSAAHPDPRLVLAVLERAAEMIEAGTSHGRAIRDAVIALGHRPGPGDGETKTGRALWIAALEESSIGEDRYRDAAARLASIRAGAAAIRSHILSVCLLVGAIAGALPVEARRLIAAYCAGDADALLALADLVEERGLTGPLAQWAEERQG